MNFEVVRSGPRPSERISPHKKSLVFPETGVLTLRKQALPPAGASIGPVL